MALRHFQWQMRPNQPQCFSSSARLRCIVGNRIVRHYPGGTSVPVALHQSWSTPLPTMPRGALGRQMQCWRTAGHFVPGPRLNVGKIHRIGREALSHRKTGLNLPSRASRSPKSACWVVSLGVVLARALHAPQKGLRMREWAQDMPKVWGFQICILFKQPPHSGRDMFDSELISCSPKKTRCSFGKLRSSLIQPRSRSYPQNSRRAGNARNDELKNSAGPALYYVL